MLIEYLNLDRMFSVSILKGLDNRLGFEFLFKRQDLPTPFRHERIVLSKLGGYSAQAR